MGNESDLRIPESTDNETNDQNLDQKCQNCLRGEQASNPDSDALKPYDVEDDLGVQSIGPR